MRILFLLYVILLSINSFAQNITGIVTDEESRPLPFVAVSIAGSANGTYTSDAGKFSIDASGIKETDQVVLSHLGYVEVKMTIAQLMTTKDPIQLQPKNYSLQQIVVGAENPKEIITDAISHIKDNYPGTFSKSHVAFKEFLKINSHDYIYEMFNFNMYLPSYLAKDSDHIYSKDISHDIYTAKGEMPNAALSPIRFMKNMYPERIFDDKALKENEFALVSTNEVIDSEEYEVVSFKRRPIKADKSIRIEGHAYINRKDKGIRFVDFHIYNEHPDRFMLLVKLDTLNVNFKLAFKKTGGKYLLDYISQAIYGRGKLIGKPVSIEQVVSVKVLESSMDLKPDEIVMKTEVSDIFSTEKPKDIKDMKGNPDIK